MNLGPTELVIIFGGLLIGLPLYMLPTIHCVCTQGAERRVHQRDQLAAGVDVRGLGGSAGHGRSVNGMTTAKGYIRVCNPAWCRPTFLDKCELTTTLPLTR